ncbi:MAG: thioredoxin domain-containing protein [Nitrospiraceae bacterium]|nr:MAG: thioredoxin domain-containing protein [Nitrospiraceae bacterium]
MRLTMIIMVLFMLLIPLTAAAADTPRIDGIYETVPAHPFEFDGKTVEIVEFLSFYCGHCYHFEKEIPVIRGNFPGKITWRIVPIYWGSASPKPGEAYFLAEEAGKGEQMKRALFHTLFADNRDISTIEVLEDLGMKTGLGFDFSKKLRAGDKARNVGEAILLSRSYDINETPTLIIAGNLKVSAGMVQGDINRFRDNVITILNSLLRKGQ